MPKLTYLGKYKNIWIRPTTEEFLKLGPVMWFLKNFFCELSFFFLPLFSPFLLYFSFYLNLEAASWMTILISRCTSSCLCAGALSYFILLFSAQSLLPLPPTPQQVCTSKYTYKYACIQVKYLVFIMFVHA